VTPSQQKVSETGSPASHGARDEVLEGYGMLSIYNLSSLTDGEGQNSVADDAAEAIAVGIDRVIVMQERCAQ
jgi:hypothetical protein